LHNAHIRRSDHVVTTPNQIRRWLGRSVIRRLATSQVASTRSSTHPYHERAEVPRPVLSHVVDSYIAHDAVVVMVAVVALVGVVGVRAHAHREPVAHRQL
jgi:hypothetical protein